MQTASTLSTKKEHRLSAREVDKRLRQALTELRNAEKKAVLWFSEVVRRKLYRDLGYSSIHQYAEIELGFKKSKTSQFLRLCESLNDLPKLRRSVAKGELSWTKAREVAKVATRKTETHWIKEAKDSPRRVLESRIAETRRRSRITPSSGLTQVSMEMGNSTPLPEGSENHQAQEIPMDIRFRMTAEQHGRYQALMEALRKRRMADSQVELLLAGLEQLVLGCESEGKVGRRNGSESGSQFTRVNSRSPYQVIVQLCPRCETGRIATSRGEKALSPQDLRAVLCDSPRKKPGKRNQTPLSQRLRHAVLERDRFRCRSAGCGRASFLAVHHLVPRTRGGSNNIDNLITLCSGCHHALHAAGDLEDHPGKITGWLHQPR